MAHNSRYRFPSRVVTAIPLTDVFSPASPVACHSAPHASISKLQANAEKGLVPRETKGTAPNFAQHRLALKLIYKDGQNWSRFPASAHAILKGESHLD